MKDIKGYEGLYAITSCGKVWSYKSQKFLKPAKDKDGYYDVSLYKDGERKHFKVHRLVAQAYIPNPNNLPLINHKNERKTDNYVSNLEWCDAKYNNNYGTRKDLNKTPVYCVELDQMFDSASDAARQLEIDNSSISKCCKGKYKTCGGYTWRYIQ